METVKLLVPLAWRNLWRNPRRTSITLIVVAAGLYSILVFAAVLNAWAKSSRDTTLDLITGSGQIHAQGYLDDPGISHTMPPASAAVAAILDGEGVLAWSARVMVPAVVQSEYRTLPTSFAGVDPQAESRLSSIPHQIEQGGYLRSSDDPGIVLGKHFAERLKTRIGKRVIVMSQAADGSLAQQSYEVVGLFSGNQQIEDQYGFAGLETVQQMLGLGDKVLEISFKLDEKVSLDEIIAALRSAAPDHDVQPWTTLSPLAAAMDAFMREFVYIWLWIMFVFMAIGIVNTQLMAVFERGHEFGLLQALGMRPRLILMQVTLESALLVGVGVLIGMLFSAITVFAASGGIDLGLLARGAEYFGASRVLYPDVSPVQFIELSLVVWVLGVVIALWPARKAARANAAEAMNHIT